VGGGGGGGGGGGSGGGESAAGPSPSPAAADGASARPLGNRTGSSPCEVLLPGTLLLHPLPLPLWQALTCTPSLIWRLEGLLAAHELRAKMRSLLLAPSARTLATQPSPLAAPPCNTTHPLTSAASHTPAVSGSTEFKSTVPTASHAQPPPPAPDRTHQWHSAPELAASPAGGLKPLQCSSDVLRAALPSQVALNVDDFVIIGIKVIVMHVPSHYVSLSARAFHQVP